MKTQIRASLTALAFLALGFAISFQLKTEAKEQVNAAVVVSPTVNPREVCSKSSRNVKACLQAALQYRCTDYSGFSVRGFQKMRNCNLSVVHMIKVMDLVQVPVSEDQLLGDNLEKSGLLLKQILFKTELEKMFSDPETEKTFQSAMLDLQDSSRFDRSHNLWDSVYEKTGNNREKSLKFITIALQDVSEGMWHIQYLDAKYSNAKLPRNSVELMNVDAAGEFTQFFQMEVEKNTQYSPYPLMNGLEKELHPFLHHFYLPAYFASELKKGGESNETAFFTAFLLNTGYEFVKLEAYSGVKPRWPFRDPRHFDPEKEKMTLRKIYTGYIGALWGLGLEKQAKSFDVFAKELSKSPFQSMRRYFDVKFK